MRPRTEERITKAIEVLGYTPNPAARQLKTGHSPFIGLIVPSVANPFYGNFVHHIEKEALKSGYQVMLGNSGRDPERERIYVSQLWGAGVKGFIFGSSLPGYVHLEQLVQNDMHLVAVDQPPLREQQLLIDTICVDNVQAIRLLVKHLYGLNHSRIGFITGPIKTLTREARVRGYRKSLVEVGLRYDKRLVWEGVPNYFGDASAVELGRQGAHHLLSQPDPPSAIIAINDMNAFGIYAGARDLGVRIPEQLSVVGIDNLALTEVVEPPLTTIDQPVADIARVAIQRLVSRMNGSCTDASKHHSLSPHLKVRASTARRT